MSFRLNPDRNTSAFASLAGALLCAVSVSAVAAPTLPSVSSFGPGTWQSLQASARPGVIVFSTTDCSYCPDAVSDLAGDLRALGIRAELDAVVMDGAGQEQTLKRDKHYRQAQRIYVFEGDPTPLRYGVNPKWRGLTPYVVVLPLQGAPSYFVGKPARDALAAALQAR